MRITLEGVTFLSVLVTGSIAIIGAAQYLNYHGWPLTSALLVGFIAQVIFISLVVYAAGKD